MARLGRGMLGLIDRDFGLSAADRQEVLAALAGILSRRREGLHISEIAGLLSGERVRVPRGVTSRMIAGLAHADPRFRIRRGQTLALSL
jgi:hypothetical protein